MSRETITKGRWTLIKEKTYGGDLFEMEERRKFWIVDQTTEEWVLFFRGEDDLSYSTSGPGWEFNASYGVLDIQLEENSAIVDYGKKQIRYVLPPPELNIKDLKKLFIGFVPYQRHLQKDPEERTQKTIEARKKLHNIIKKMGIQKLVWNNIIVPDNICTTHPQYTPLIEWMEKGQYQEKE